MTQHDALLSSLSPIARLVATLNLSAPAQAEAQLNEAFPLPELNALRKLAVALNSAGELTPKNGGPTITFGRVSKPSERTGGCSIDAVDMRGAALGHTHPKGEVSLCFTLNGTPDFLGRSEGWVVAAPGSHHVPTVNNGRMLIVYFLPNGEMIWDR